MFEEFIASNILMKKQNQNMNFSGKKNKFVDETMSFTNRQLFRPKRGTCNDSFFLKFCLKY